jgi:multicomponent Na+:H+ antiporter subunit C
MTEFTLAVALGTLFAVGTFLVLRQDVVRVVWGVAIISQAANVYLITVGFGPTGEAAAPVVSGYEAASNTADPLVQALVLTAIVIGFGTTAFALVLTYRLYEEHGTIDLRGVSYLESEGPVGPSDEVTRDDVEVSDD